MNPAEFIACDVETTGLSPSRGHRVIEIGAVRVKNGTPVKEFHSLIACGRGITKGARQIHGISEAMLQGQPEPQTVFAAFRTFIGQTPLAAHNAAFDLDFLRSEFSRLGWSLTNPTLCTLQASRRRLPWLPNYRLETVARHLLGDLPADTWLHRALGDARLVAKVWLKLEMM
jgi:DNA polymerase-3 subunit epsilon